MQLVYYIFDDAGNVLAIFNSEELAIDYLEHMFMDESNCKQGVVGESIFRFEEHDAKYHTLKDSSITEKRHLDCKRFVKLHESEDDSTGYCFFIDEMVDGLDSACNLIEVKK